MEQGQDRLRGRVNNQRWAWLQRLVWRPEKEEESAPGWPGARWTGIGRLVCHSAGGMSTGENSFPRTEFLGVKDIRAGREPPLYR